MERSATWGASPDSGDLHRELQPRGSGWQLDRLGNKCGRGMVIQGGNPGTESGLQALRANFGPKNLPSVSEDAGSARLRRPAGRLPVVRACCVGAAGVPPRPINQRKIERPAYSAVSPSISSMRISWLYLASRSDRANEPVLI